VKSATRGELSDAEWKIYSFIARSFLGCISTDATYDSVAVVFDAAGETLKLQGRILIHPGFLEVMTWHGGSDTEIPDFGADEVVKVTQNKIIEGVTQAPGFLSEANLIAKMEKHGIGTDASIATHINNIILRNYVTVRDPGRQLVPTPLGYALVKGYCEIDPELVLPQVRQNIEKSCEMIAKGKVDFSRVVSHVT
jgi:DNA topoisomerase-3